MKQHITFEKFVFYLELLSVLILFQAVGELSYSSGSMVPGIQGSPHDFTNLSWSTGEICKACHAPHNADSVVAAPLWNHSSTQQTFIPYQNSTMVATIGQPDGESKLCLSCHDGTVALDAFGGSNPSLTASTIGNPIGPDLNSGQGHSLTHPISFVYDSTLAATDTELIDPNQPQSILGGDTIRNKLLMSNKVQCSSCHDVHNKQGLDKLLRLTLDNDTLCVACHTLNK